MNLSSAPRNPTPDQFRRCATCKATRVCAFTPSTAVRCACGGDMLLSPMTPDDLRAETERCAVALDALAATCENSAGPDGKVSAAGAARHMRNLATWMRTEEASK